jgi:hypothetical protein
MRIAASGVMTLGTQEGGEMEQATVIEPRPNMPRERWSTMLVLGVVQNDDSPPLHRSS